MQSGGNKKHNEHPVGVKGIKGIAGVEFSASKQLISRRECFQENSHHIVIVVGNLDGET